MKETTASPAESARRITFLLNRLTVLRTLLRTDPAARLVELCDAVAAGDGTAAAARYHSMTAALLDQPAYAPFWPVIRAMLADGLRVEQEAIPAEMVGGP